MKSFILFFIFFLFQKLGMCATTSSWEYFYGLGQKILDQRSYTHEVRSLEESFKKSSLALKDPKSSAEETKNLNDKVTKHLNVLKKNLYAPAGEVYLDILSFQDEIAFNSLSSQTKLIATHSGYCLGGSYGRANNRYHLFGDGCFYYGWANVGPQKNNNTLKKNSTETFGLKLAPAAGIFVSPEKVEIGLKIPILFIDQKLSNPDKSLFPGYHLDKGSNIKILSSLYFRWPFRECLLQMELGKFIEKDTTLWSIGAGFRF